MTSPYPSFGGDPSQTPAPDQFSRPADPFATSAPPVQPVGAYVPPQNFAPQQPQNFAPQQPQGFAPGPQGTPPDNNLVWAILATLLCFLPTGIVAIVNATQVQTKWAMGDYAGARKASEDAMKWSKWSLIIGVIGVVLYIGLMILVAAFGSYRTY